MAQRFDELESNAQIGLERALDEKRQFEQQLKEKRTALERRFEPAGARLEPLEVKPGKSDIAVQNLALVWLLWRIDPTGAASPVY